VVKVTGARDSLNMISAVTAQGLLRFSTYSGSFTGARFIEFCRKLIADTDRPVYLVGDGHPTHRSKAAKDFVASTDGQLKLFVLPAYSTPIPRTQPRRVGLGERQTRPGRTYQRHRPRRVQDQGHQRATPLTEDAPHHPRVLRRSRPTLHHGMIVR
jgi:hypothetical protein